MPQIGKIEQRLLNEMDDNRCLHFTLVDPDISLSRNIGKFAKIMEKAGTSAFLIGGSTGGSVYEIDQAIEELRSSSDLPIILFPGGSRMVSRKADAILFISLLNSTNTQYVIGEQVQGAPLIKKYGLETIPVAYLVLGDRNSSVGFVGQANPIPFNKPAIATSYALAAQFLGMRFVYLEAGSGAKRPVPPTVISAVRKATAMKIIVGGGIHDGDSARRVVEAGANAIVTGTLIEKRKLSELKTIITNLSDVR